MSEKRSLQEWLHWFEEGEGSRWVRVAVLALGVLLLSCFIGYKQFRGPLSEATFAQAVVGRQLASGEGFTTPVNFPQSFAWAEARQTGGRFLNLAKPLPELHQPPLYSAVLGAVFAVTPARGVRADYVLLIVNVLLLWCAAMQTFFLAKRLFGMRAGLVALCALLLSAPVWAAAMAVSGASLLMVLWLAMFHIGTRAYANVQEENSRSPWAVPRRHRVALAFSGGGVIGLLFLCDYATMFVLPVVLVEVFFRTQSWRRASSIALGVLGFALVVSPWIVRNILLTENPFALASQGLALKAGDPTAEPAIQRATFSAEAPDLDFKKLGNKVLTALQRGVGERVWSGGGIFLTAFFLAGFAYRFRNPTVNRLRWMVVGMIALWVMTQAFFDAGEGERDAWLCLTPMIVIFGAGFFVVLLESNEVLAQRAGIAIIVLLAAQALPLAREVLQPRSSHSYNYPPYLPTLFEGVGQKLSEGRAEPLAWMCDVPAGAAWYSGQRVWMQPATMSGFGQVARWQPVRALVLTPQTLAKPFFGELTKPVASGGTSAAGVIGLSDDWAAVYRGLAAGRMPAGFPLSTPVRIAADFYVLIDPGVQGVNAEGR